jgi:hypothetical protein
VEPRDAAIYRNGVYAGNGILLADRLEPDTAHEFTFTAAGYHDSTFSLELAADEARDVQVALRPQLGSLHVRTTPAGAALMLNGQSKGTSPLTIERLAVNTEWDLRVALAGFDDQSRTIRLLPDSTVTEVFDLTRTQFPVLVSTTPLGARLSIDGQALPVPSPTTVYLTAGEHRIGATLAGHVSLDSLVTVSDESPLFLRMTTVPPGYLMAQGTRSATFYFDGVVVMENSWNSGRKPISPGTHEIRIELSDTTMTRTVEVRSGQLTRFDFSDGTIHYEPVPGD